MTEQEWVADLGPYGPYPQFSFVQKQRDLRLLLLFGCACCRRVWDLLPLPASRRLIELAEAWADGETTEAELEAANGSVEFSDMEAQSDGEAGNGQFSARIVEAIKATRMLVDPFEASFAYSVARKTSLVTANRIPYPNTTLPTDAAEWAVKGKILRDIFGDPFRPVTFKPDWRTATVITLATQMYNCRDFSLMSILADALEDACCNSEGILDHCRSTDPHVRGCFVLDLILGKRSAIPSCAKIMSDAS